MDFVHIDSIFYLATYYTIHVASLLTSIVLILLCFHYLRECVSRRLWLFPCYPASFIALNAGTLALLNFSVKTPLDILFAQIHRQDRQRSEDENGSYILFYTLISSVLASALMAACMPSLATADRSQIWSNLAGAVLLLMTIISNIFPDSQYIHNHAASESIKYQTYAVLIIITICISLDILILIAQACNSDVMISEVTACISIRLNQLEMIVRESMPARGPVDWMGWEELECRTYIKLMMALTGNLQNVASRSPASAILAVSFLVTAPASLFALVRLSSGRDLLFFVMAYTPLVSAPLLGIISVNRWLRLAIHDYRPLCSLLFDSGHPFYRHQKIMAIWHQLKDGPPRRLQIAGIRQLTTLTLKRVIYLLSALLMRSFIIPMQWILMVCVRLTHALTTLSVRLLGMNRMFHSRCNSETPVEDSPPAPAVEDSPRAPYACVDACLDAGVIHITGEDPRTVRKLFAASAKLVIQKQRKKAASRSTIDLEMLLGLSNQACFFESSVVYEVLDKRGIPDVPMLQARCHYGDQYGWSVTALSLLVVMSRVEMAALGTSKTTMAAMRAYEQAKEMVKVVDEMHTPVVCSKDEYRKASASLWSSLMNESRPWPRASRVHTLDLMSSLAMSELQRSAHDFPWTMEVVKAYTMYTVCQNLRRWYANNGEGQGRSRCLVQHIAFLSAEVLAACLCSLPAVLETRTRRAICNGHVAEIEDAILLVGQAQKIWKSLQWPQCKVDDLLVDIPTPGFPLNQYWLHPRL